MGRMVLIPGAERRVSQWAGGTSSQIYIWPQDAEYAKRNFWFRVSTATANTDEVSQYTDLPGVARHLLMLEGTAQVCHKDRYTLTMTPYKEIDSFDGGWDTCASGKVRDFNLMTREGCTGSLTVLDGDAGVSLDEGVTHVLLFCSQGSATVTDPQGEAVSLEDEDTLLIAPAGDFTISMPTDGRVILVKVSVPTGK